MEIDKIVIITRPTRLEESIKRFNTKSQVQFFIESRGQSFDDYEMEYDNYHRSKDAILTSIDAGLKTQIVDRAFLPNFIFGDKDLVLVIGQDGLVVNVAKYLDGQAVLAVNPDPERFDGVLLPFKVDDVKRALNAYANSKLEVKTITMARVDLNDGQSMFAFNDFFIGANSHISARYTIMVGGNQERHSSSGIIVSTPAGSTGWLSSLFNMNNGMSRFRGASGLSDLQAMSWDLEKLVYVVREPFRSKWSAADIVAGEIKSDDVLEIESHMLSKGVIFSDGIENDFLEFNSGTKARIQIAEKKTRLLAFE